MKIGEGKPMRVKIIFGNSSNGNTDGGNMNYVFLPEGKNV